MILAIVQGIALGLCCLCAVLSWTFVARHSRTNWTSTPGGKWLMRSKIAMALLFTFTLLGQFVPMRPLTAAALAVLLFGWTAYALWDLVRMQNVELRRARAERDAARGIMR